MTQKYAGKAGCQPHENWIRRKYGSRRGFVKTLWYQLLYLAGRYRRYKKIDWNLVDRLVFVCKGNICRSAFAEKIAQDLGVEAISCGLDAIEHAPANIDAQQAAKELGYDLEQHKTTPVMYVMLKKTDLLVAMEPWQVEFLNKNIQRYHQYTLLGLWHHQSLPHLHDPYGNAPVYFEQCFKVIRQCVDVLVQRMDCK